MEREFGCLFHSSDLRADITNTAHVVSVYVKQAEKRKKKTRGTLGRSDRMMGLTGRGPVVYLPLSSHPIYSTTDDRFQMFV